MKLTRLSSIQYWFIHTEQSIHTWIKWHDAILIKSVINKYEVQVNEQMNWKRMLKIKYEF